ncbi:hypothetical protein WG78_19420 [Amantichitinum ursilacus]|uniref:Uncharacterized protein n=1 Tax=Amantichitinum ursilacus TaxID=857265 RepID=A0A0N0GL14_9NEIS|nr:hypothetical protein WG78_19420 [Amantichitinum ursilacus]
MLLWLVGLDPPYEDLSSMHRVGHEPPFKAVAKTVFLACHFGWWVSTHPMRKSGVGRYHHPDVLLVSNHG